MPQYNYAYPAGQVGQVGTYATGDVVSINNPLRAQVSNVDVNGGTTNGTYTVQAVAGGLTVTASFVAAGLTAAQIAAGIAAAILADPSFAGAVQSAVVAGGDQVNVTFQQAGLTWTVTMSSDPSTGMIITTTTTAGFTQVAPGIVLQSDTAGGFTTTYTDAALALGVTIRNADLVNPLTAPANATGYDGPTMMSLVRRGEIYVEVVSGTTVLLGDQAYFDPAGTWDNAGAGSHVIVEGAQWQTSGTGVQRVYVNLPSET